MKNELRIKPLLKYTVSYVGQPDLVFTGDEYEWDIRSQSYKFYRTGNLIRELMPFGVAGIVVTPVDDEDAA